MHLPRTSLLKFTLLHSRIPGCTEAQINTPQWEHWQRDNCWRSWHFWNVSQICLPVQPGFEYSPSAIFAAQTANASGVYIFPPEEYSGSDRITRSDTLLYVMLHPMLSVLQWACSFESPAILVSNTRSADPVSICSCYMDWTLWEGQAPSQEKSDQGIQLRSAVEVKR